MSESKFSDGCCVPPASLLGLFGVEALYVLFRYGVFADEQIPDESDLVALDEDHLALLPWARRDRRAGRHPVLTPIKLYSAITLPLLEKMMSRITCAQNPLNRFCTSPGR